jgi:hypothetical protein
MRLRKRREIEELREKLKSSADKLNDTIQNLEE